MKRITRVVVAAALLMLTTYIHAEGMRVEAGAGRCKHHLAPDASWHYAYGQYQTQMELNPFCYQLGLSVMPFEWKSVKWGARLGLVDLGRVTADNTYPVNEQAYFVAKDTRTAVQSDTARFQGYGTHRGVTLGLAAERKLFVFDVGAEGGVAVLRNTWHVNFPNFGAANATGCRQDWACADSNNATWYAGVNVRWEYLFVSVRRYNNVHASRATNDPLFIGPTSGAVIQTTIGASFPL